ncbi:hypothetical protein Vretimale_18517 [Volvox reticuliferus]|uniref:Bystin n=1 Tax=Volvox reticuliferus TaxID=1737510 RepID=A0A8J4GV56_9CHLO|nr:hypothetical protein Vretimale_18517 [Volvox reticuliferus]
MPMASGRNHGRKRRDDVLMKMRRRSVQGSFSEQLLDAKTSGRILKAAREQQQELDAEELFDLDHDDADNDGEGKKRVVDPQAALRAALQKLGTGGQSGKGAREDDDSDDDSDGKGAAFINDEEQYEEDEVEIDPEDQRALEAFFAPGADSYRQTSLADLILSKLRERQVEQGLPQLPHEGEDDPSLGPGPVPDGLEPRVVEVYRGVGKLMSRYTAGKIPKAFKIIPNLRTWEDVLYLTDPDSWSVHAMYQATRLFVSNLNARLAQRFLALVLLPRVRAEIRQHKRLHFALFQALRKATYKPGAFYKGILLPLCQSRTCTLREAVILTSVLKRASLPVLHSSAALLRLAQLEYCGTTSFFMRVLLDKKYALPYRVIDALVDHFVRFADDERQMPVVWHQTLLCFVQRYKHEIRAADLQALRGLCSKQHHYKVTPEVIRELDHAMGRGCAAAVGTQGGGVAPMTVQGLAAGAANMGSSIVENVRDMPPVLMMED